MYSMTIKRTLSSIVLAGTLAFSGLKCSSPSNPQEYLEGKVIKEGGTAVNLVESSGAIFGNESVKLGYPTYIITVETSQGKYVMNVIDDYNKPLVALAEAIEVGDRIRFRTTYRGCGHEDCFSRDRIGGVYSDYIELLGK